MFDSSGESNPFDWYHARLNIDFKLQLLADGGNVGNNVQTGMVNSAYSLIKKLNVKMKGVDVYDCDNANHAINIKKSYWNIQKVKVPMSSFIKTKIEVMG